MNIVTTDTKEVCMWQCFSVIQNYMNYYKLCACLHELMVFANILHITLLLKLIFIEIVIYVVINLSTMSIIRVLHRCIDTRENVPAI